MKKLITLSLVFILCSNIVITSQDTFGINQSENISEIESQEPTKNFEDLYLQQKDFNEKILNTVYWALSSFLFVLLAIIGSNLYYNYHFNKKKYDDLIEKHQKQYDEQKVTLLNKIIDELDIAFKDITEKNIAFKKEIDEELKQDRKVVSEDYKERLTVFSNNLSEQTTTIKSGLDDYKNIMTKQVSFVEAGLASMKDSIEKDLKSLQRKIDESIGRVWKVMERYHIAITYYLDQAIIEIDLKQFYSLKYTLRYIIEILEKSTKIYDLDLARIDTLLPLIPDNLIEDKKKIIEAVRKLIPDYEEPEIK